MAWWLVVVVVSQCTVVVYSTGACRTTQWYSGISQFPLVSQSVNITNWMTLLQSAPLPVRSIIVAMWPPLPSPPPSHNKMLLSLVTLVSLAVTRMVTAAPPPDKPLLDSVTEHFAAARPGTVPRIPARLFLQVDTPARATARDEETQFVTNSLQFPPLVSCILEPTL